MESIAHEETGKVLYSIFFFSFFGCLFGLFLVFMRFF